MNEIALKQQDPTNELQVGYKWAGENGSCFLIPFPNNPTLLNIQTYLRSVLPASTEFLDPSTFHATLLYMPQGDTFTPSADLLTYLPSFSIRSMWLTYFDTPDGFAIVIGLERDTPLMYLQSALFYQALYEGIEISPFSWNRRYTPHVTLAYIPKAAMPDGGFDSFMPMDFSAGVFEIAYSGADESLTLYSLGMLPTENESEETDAHEMAETPEQETVEEMIETLMEQEDYSESKNLTILARVKAWFKKRDDLTFDTETGFKMLDDGQRWIAWYTNGYKDRDDQWCATKAVAESIDYIWETKQFPELWHWHIGDIRKDWKPTRHGQADWVGMIGRFAIATGTFDNTPFAESMKAYYKKNADKLGVSQGFFYNPSDLKGGVFHKFRTFEISTLPANKASNPFTPFGLIEGASNNMATQEQIKALQEIIGADLTKEILTRGESATKTLDEKVAFKATLPPEEEPTDDEAEPETENTKAIQSLSELVAAQTIAIKAIAEMLKPDLAVKEADPIPRDQAAPIELDERRKAMILADYMANQEKQIDQRSNDPAANLMSMLTPPKAK